MCANSDGSGETAWMGRLAWAFAGHLSDKYHNLMSWLKYEPHMRKLFMPYANNKGADQPAHPRGLISIFVVCCLDSILPFLAKSKISRPLLVSEVEQAGLSIT